MKLSIQLYSFRDFFDLDGMLKFCKAEGLQYVEPAGLSGLSAKDFASKVKAHGLEAYSIHFGLDELEKNWEEFARELPACGITNFVMPYADANNKAEVATLAARLQKLAVQLKAKNIKLHYHNHSHELLKKFEGKSFMDHLLEMAPDLGWEVDVGWVTGGKEDVPATLKKWQDRISILHIKDILQELVGAGHQGIEKKDGVDVVLASKGGQPKEMGKGVVDFAGIFAQAKAQNIQQFVLENDNPVDPESFTRSGIALVKKYN